MSGPRHSAERRRDRVAAERWGVASGPAGSGKAGTVLINVAVLDLDQAISEIEARGKYSLPVVTIEGAGRKAQFIDPEGNSTTFIEVLAPVDHSTVIAD